MVRIEERIPQVVAAVAARTNRLVDCLSDLDDDGLLAASRLSGWTRLTIACHLRYGAQALRTMTEAAVIGQPAAYYPEGRAAQRPGTLAPIPGESPRAVVASLAQSGENLHRLWSTLKPPQWSVEITEPPGNADLGTVPLARLALLRLTEVEVHGTDLGLDLDDWGETFVLLALPLRIEWLTSRRTNHRDFDRTLNGSWLLVATDGPTYRVSVNGSRVAAQPASPGTPARSSITATSRDLLALLLGRPFQSPPIIGGDIQFGESFSAAFPGP